MNIDGILQKTLQTIETHKVAPGAYSRWLWQNKIGSRVLGVNEYGCADAANILYTLQAFPKSNDEKDAFVKTLQGMQNSESGLFQEKTHHTIHTTAHCTAALELFDAKPLYKFHNLKRYTTVEGLYGLLEGIDWQNNAWDGSHEGAGIYAALVLNEEVDSEWEKAYFDWFYENADPDSGMWRKNYAKPDTPRLYEHMAGTFHYLFNHEYAKMPLRYPDKMIDSCIDMYKRKTLTSDFGRTCNFLEIDFVYCMTRAMRQTPHRFFECKEILMEFATGYVEYLEGLDWETDEGVNDLHCLFGVICCLAELQSALPGFLISEKPMRLVLDRRPFI